MSRSEAEKLKTVPVLFRASFFFSNTWKEQIQLKCHSWVGVDGSLNDSSDLVLSGGSCPRGQNTDVWVGTISDARFRIAVVSGSWGGIWQNIYKHVTLWSCTCWTDLNVACVVSLSCAAAVVTFTWCVKPKRPAVGSCDRGRVWSAFLASDPLTIELLKKHWLFLCLVFVAQWAIVVSEGAVDEIIDCHKMYPFAYSICGSFLRTPSSLWTLDADLQTLWSSLFGVP